MIFVRIGRRLDRRLEARPSAAKYIPSVNASRSRAGAAERARPMATVPRGGSALARIAGNCLAAMAHTMGCGALAARARLRLRPEPSNAVGRFRCRWHRHRRPLRPGIHDSLPWKKTPPRRPIRPPPRRRLAREASPGRTGRTERVPAGRSILRRSPVSRLPGLPGIVPLERETARTRSPG